MIEKVKEYSAIIALVVVYLLGVGSHVLYSNSVTQAIAETRKAAAESAANEISKIEIKNSIIQQKVIERVKTEVVYSECKHSPDTYQLILDAYKK